MKADPAHSIILMMEVMEEASYVPHHPKKIAFIFSAMRHFAQELRETGWLVDYVALDDPGNTGTFTDEVARAINRHSITNIALTEPSEFRVMELVRGWQDAFGITVHVQRDDRFVCSLEEFSQWAEGRKSLRMEYFYREMRKKTGLLMKEGKPEGGKWNFDKENRKPAGDNLFMPRPKRFAPDAITQEVLQLVEAQFPDNFGSLDDYWFGASRADAENALESFLSEALPQFGEFQDAMLEGQNFLYHAVISLYLNIGLLSPLGVCLRVEEEYRAGRVPINSAEGFIRQIIGWREYVRGIYWREMPGYQKRNDLSAHRALPSFYWTGDTQMNCLRTCISQTRDEAYAHHIQRLMITGNFALIAGIDPEQVHEWYLAVYADAFEWVELPNTLGMSQFADGGILASKPYASSGTYIDKMSDYCGACRYSVKVKEGEDACPFNYLYWDFISRHEERFKNNPRMAMIVRSYGKFSPAKKSQIATDASRFLSELN